MNIKIFEKLVFYNLLQLYRIFCKNPLNHKIHNMPAKFASTYRI